MSLTPKQHVLIVLDQLVCDNAPGLPRFYNSTGASVEPCPECGRRILPGEPRAYVPGNERPTHAECFRCHECGGLHVSGFCLI